MRAKRLAAGALILALAGCGGGEAATERAVDEVADDGASVVEAWAEAVREGDYDAANDLFAVPATIVNIGPKVRITEREGIDAFNRSLPCGAEVTDTQVAGGGYLRVSFELVAGADGTPCEGPAEVSFRIVDGHITEWLREDGQPADPNTTET